MKSPGARIDFSPLSYGRVIPPPPQFGDIARNRERRHAAQLSIRKTIF
jgi:hypothetical protein